MADNPFTRPKPKQVKEVASNWLTVASALIKQHDIHEGLWRVHVKFDLRAANMAITPEQTVPAAFVPVIGVILRRVELGPGEKIDPLTVDAELVNPQSRIITPGVLLN